MNFLIDAHPDDADFYSVRASMYAEHRQPELALFDLDHAIALEPENANFLLARAHLHQQLGNASRARHDFERAAALGTPSVHTSKTQK